MSTAREPGPPAVDEAAIWQQVEFGSYNADLPLWLELATAAHGPVLELGAGAGRVAFHLAERGHQVIAVEREDRLLEELETQAARTRSDITVVRADLASPADIRLRASPDLVVGPLHVIQLLDGAGRPALLSWLAELAAPGGLIALTVVDESTLLSAGTSAPQILPDMREVDDWVFSSEPLWVQVDDEALKIRRIRERVSPGGAIDRRVHDELLYRLSPERLELEAENVGLTHAARRQIVYGPNEADSTVVLLEVPA
jgi:SAM-dependent methyltransferase